jgi:penicillin-binding protein 1B
MLGVKKEFFRIQRATIWKFIVVIVLVITAWLIYLDAQIRFKFEGQRWSLPAQVFARSLEIYEGKTLNLKNLQQELKLLNYQSAYKIQQSGQYKVTENIIELYIRSHSKPEEDQASQHIRFTIQGDQVRDLVNLGNQERTIYYLEPFKIGGIYPNVKEERQLLSISEFPDQLKKTLLVTEDRNFYSHMGISPSSIARAMWANINAGKIVQGGSTLTQQLVKNFFLTSEQSLLRKVNEAMMSLLLEIHYNKDVILETYMNDIFLGQSGKLAIHGFEAASNFYFGKHLSECDQSELALLVAMVKGPSYYNPRRFAARAKIRRNLVLSLLHQEKYLDEKALAITKAKPLKIVTKPLQVSNRYPAFMDFVKRQLRETYQDDDLRSEGLKVYTTLDPQIQFQLERASTKKMAELSSAINQETLQTASVVTTIGSGEIVGLIGDKQPRYQGFNRALDAKRPIGSLIKPAIYLTALAQSQKYHLSSLLNDQAFKLEFDDGQIWQPQNFDKKDHGHVLLTNSLMNSYNLSTARLGIELGIPDIHATLKKLGVKGQLNPYPSLFLGSQSLSPMEVSQMYLTFANQGFNMPLRAIREVTTAQGEVVSRYPFQVEQVFSPESVFLLQHGLQSVMRSGTGRSAYYSLSNELDLAGKTGTTNDNRDSWFAGFSGDYLSVVWIGNDDNTPTAFTGSSGALTVWTEFMRSIPQSSVAMVQPESIHYYWFDMQSGKRTDEQCKEAVQLPIWGDASHLPYQSCNNGFSSFKGWIKSWF